MQRLKQMVIVWEVLMCRILITSKDLSNVLPNNFIRRGFLIHLILILVTILCASLCLVRNEYLVRYSQGEKTLLKCGLVLNNLQHYSAFCQLLCNIIIAP